MIFFLAVDFVVSFVKIRNVEKLDVFNPSFQLDWDPLFHNRQVVPHFF